MRASEIEFRLRMLIIAAIMILGFWAPWIGEADLGKRIPLLEWLALEASRTGLLRFSYATPLIIVLGAMLALIGATLRVWGTAYLGYATVQNGRMLAGCVMADGPYRYLRNPLYVGAWFTLAASALVMPPTGALVAMVLLTVFYLRLTLGEEGFLRATLGQPYRDYIAAVPRFKPLLHASLLPAGNKPHWFAAIFGELYPIGVLVTMAGLAWRFDHQLMLYGILFSFIASLIARGLVKALLPTLAFFAYFAIALGWFHAPWTKTAIIAFGIALLVRAAMPPVAKPRSAGIA
jgi:protein-S-isoprenylcysteine O-methyltransferase Ste14